jgi:iron complex outermembrane receptor protein
VVFGHCSPTKPNVNNAGMTARTRSDTYYLTSRMDYALTSVTLTSVTGHINDKHVNRQDSDGEPEAIGDAIDDPARYTQISEEFRVASNKSGGLDLGGKLDWVLGGYFSSFRYEDSQNLNILGTLLSNNQRGTSRSYALFGHAIYNLTDRLSFSFGARQTWDHKTHNYISTGETMRYVDAPASWNNFSIEAGAQYKFGPNRLVYFRYGQGYRGGGFQGLPSPGGTGGTYSPETVDTFELGLKADWFDQHLRVNLAVFDSAYSGLQRNVLKSLPIAPFFQQVIQNAASARTKGVELEITAVPLPGLTLDGTLGYIDPKFKDFIAAIIPNQPPTDNSDFPFPFTSKWTAKLGAAYAFSLPGGLGFGTANVDWNYRSSFSAANLPYPAAQVDGFGLLNASFRFEDPTRRYSLTLYGRNITNKIWRTQVLTVPGQLAPFFITQASKPVVYGATLGFKF